MKAALAFVAVVAAAQLGCVSEQAGTSNGAGGAPASTVGAGGGAAAAGTGGSGGSAAGAGAGGAAGGGGNSGASGSGGGSGSAGGGGGAGGDTRDAGMSGDGAGGASKGGAGGAGANDCKLPATVSFQADVQQFLGTSCGGGNGCHVIDAVSTKASGGYDHAYDWITAGAHASSCPSTPTPMRFEIIMAVINGANPPSCSRSRKMPPPDATGAGARAPLTACQVAALQAWLQEPLVTQMHRADDSSPTTPYPMPPFN